MLQEAVRNEAINIRSLELMLNFEETNKIPLKIRKLNTLPNVRYYSKKGYVTTITFENMTEYPQIFKEQNNISCIINLYRS